MLVPCAAMAQESDPVTQGAVESTTEGKENSSGGSLVAQADQTPQSASSAAPTAQNATAPSTAGQLQEVVVTAERRAENVQTTAIAMNAISGADLQQDHINSLLDLPNVAPIGVANAGWHQQINIRGIGSETTYPGINTGIAVIRDGLFEAETTAQSEPLYDIADTEVLRGPQGTFVGYASTGGAVEINSANPNFTGFGGYFTAGIGNYNDRLIEGAVNMPVTDTLALRVAFNMETRNSFFTDLGSSVTGGSAGPIEDVGNLDNKNIRLSLLWKPSDSFQALLKSSYDNEKSAGLPTQVDPYPYNSPCAKATGPCTPGGLVYAPFYSEYSGQPFVLNPNFLAQQNQMQKSATGLELRFTLPDLIVLRSMTGFEQIGEQLNQDSDAVNSEITNGVEPPGLSTALAGFPSGGQINPCNAAFVAAKGSGDCGQWRFIHNAGDDYYSQEFDVVSPSPGRLTWMAGATVFYRNSPSDSISYNGENPYTPTNPNDTIQLGTYVQRLGGEFGQISWQFSDTLQLQVGLRHNWDSNYTTGNRETYNPTKANPYSYSGKWGNGAACTSLTENGCISRTYKDSVPTGKVGLNWTPMPGQFFYAFVARGYQVGGINNDYTTFNPEHVNDYELGWKGNFAQNRIQTQLGGYWMSFQNYQSLILSPVSGVQDVINLPTATIQGIEASIQGHLAHWDFDAAIYYNKTANGTFTTVAAYKLPSVLPQNTPGCPAGTPTPANYNCFNYAPYEVTLGGQENSFSPPLTANADLGYRIPLGNGTLEPRVSYSHTDKQYASIFQTDNYYLMGVRNLYGADLDYRAGPWLVDVYGTNLTNKTYIAGYAPSGNLNEVYYGNPRQYGLRLTYQY